MIRRAVARLFARLLRGPRVHPEFLAACDRARLERLTGRGLGPCVPVDGEPIGFWPVDLPESAVRAMAWDARFDEIAHHATDGDIDEYLAEIDPVFAEWLRQERRS